MSTGYTLRRPSVTCPIDASLLAYEFSDLLIETLNQGCLVSYLGWYVDSPARGPVWHRWGKGESARVGVSLIVTIYALWVSGDIDVVVHPRDGSSPEVFLVRAVGSLRAAGTREGPDHEHPPLEQDVLALIHAESRLRPRELIERLPFPSKRRGIGAWLFSGSPSAQKHGKEGWFKRTSTFPSEAPMHVAEALDLAKALVILESGTDVPEDERDRRDEATYGMEVEIFDAIQKLP